MNPLNFTSTYNSEEFFMVFTIYTDDISLTAPDRIKNDKKSLIPTESIIYINLTNSIYDWVPTLTMKVFDSGFSISNYLKGQNTRISVKLAKGSRDNEVLEMNLIFLVKGYTPSDNEAESTTYTIYGELDSSIALNTHCTYATSCSLETDAELMENPYKIAKAILNQVGYRLYPTDQAGSSGAPIATKYDLPYTNEICHFITNPNMTCKEALFYLFSYAVGENGLNPPAFLVHNLYDNLGYITSFDDIFKESSIKMQPANSRFPFSMTNAPIPDRHYLMSHVAMVTKTSDGVDFATGIKAAELMNNYKFFEYSQEDREWENYSITKITIDDLVTKGINQASDTSIYLHSFTEDIEHSLYRQSFPHDHKILYDVMRHLVLYGSVMTFSVDGGFLLDVGQVITVLEPGSSGDRVEQLHGRWVIVKIVHSFHDQIYRSHIVCARTFNSVKDKMG